MPLSRKNTRNFHRKLYAGQLEKVRLLKRGDDQQQGTVTPYTLYGCMLPGTMVSGRITGVSKAWYAGEAVEIGVAGDTTLCATVNHPVLTPEGFVAAGLVKPGNHVIQDCGCIDPRSYDVQHGPLPIEEVFQSLLETGKPVYHRPSVLDFHGDGALLKGDVEIVRTNRTLRDHVNTGGQEFGNEFGFDWRYPPRPGLGKVDPQRIGPWLAAGSCIGSLGLLVSLRRGHPGPLSPLTITGRPEFYTGEHQYTPDGISVETQRRGDCRHAFTFGIPSDHRAPVRVGRKTLLSFEQASGIPEFVALGPGARFDTRRLEAVEDSHAGNPEFLSQLTRSFPGEVSLGQIGYVRRFHYDGPVYDLETPLGYYTAAATGVKVFVSNCRRSSIQKSGNTLDGDLNVGHKTRWHIPRAELDRVGVNYLNPLDQVQQLDGVEAGNIWSPEADTGIDVKLFANMVVLDCKLRKPKVSRVGVPGY